MLPGLHEEARHKSMLFCESYRDWGPIPPWAGFLLSLGYRWPTEKPVTRRLALISMPCDSAAAGLLTLGALIRDLTNPEANDIAGHYDGLLRHAQQYLESCRDCELETCNPEVKRCGHLAEASGRVRSNLFPRRTYVVSERTNVLERRLAFSYRDKLYFPNPDFVSEWHFEGDPPPKVDSPQGELAADPYRRIIENDRIFSENLRKTYSGLCLAGRSAGEKETREILASIRFRDGTEEFSLEKLLTIHGWSATSVSRVSFFNGRTETIDRTSGSPALVVADGDASFLRVASRPEFQQSDILGVISCASERDALEAVGNKMQALRQWYHPDAETFSRIGPVPRGVSLSILRRR